MQDLEAIVGQLGTMAKAFKEGGLFLFLGLIIILAFLGFKAFLAHRKASQSVTVNYPVPAPQPGNGSGKVCLLHSGVEQQLEAMEEWRKENRSDHGKIFDAINNLKMP